MEICFQCKKLLLPMSIAIAMCQARATLDEGEVPGAGSERMWVGESRLTRNFAAAARGQTGTDSRERARSEELTAP
jgi:hypothetical protein